MDGSAVHCAAAVFTATACIRRGRRAAAGAGDCRFGSGSLLDLFAHIPADLRQNLSDFLAELFQLRYSTLVSGLYRDVMPGRVPGGGVMSTELELIWKRISSK